MKTAEQFRKSIGGADEKFVRVIRQTLREMQCEEEKPVKKKISLGLVLAAAIMLLTVTAFAASQWGILDFIKGQGKNPAEEKLVSTIVQKCSESKWISVTIDEALIDGDTAYLAMTVMPKTEKTLIVPVVDDLSTPGGMAAMSNLGQERELSVRAYAEGKGFEQVIGFEPPGGGSLDKLQSVVYESLENGGLRCIYEYGYRRSNGHDFPEKTEWSIWTVRAIEYGEDDVIPDSVRVSRFENVFVEAEIPVNISLNSRKSLASDAHDIVGYNGCIDYITMTPLEDGSVQFTMMIDMNDADEKEMYFYTADLMDGDGNSLCWLNGSLYNMGTSNKRLLESTIPAEHAQAALADQVTIQVYGLSGNKPTYDTYTYTME